MRLSLYKVILDPTTYAVHCLFCYTHHSPVGLYAGKLWVCILGVNGYDDAVASLMPVIATRHLLLVLQTHT